MSSLSRTASRAKPPGRAWSSEGCPRAEAVAFMIACSPVLSMNVTSCMSSSEACSAERLTERVLELARGGEVELTRHLDGSRGSSLGAPAARERRPPVVRAVRRRGRGISGSRWVERGPEVRSRCRSAGGPLDRALGDNDTPCVRPGPHSALVWGARSMGHRSSLPPRLRIATRRSAASTTSCATASSR